MNKRKTLLDHVWAEYVKGDRCAEIFLMEIYMHYAKIDLETGENLAVVFKELYLSKERLSYDDISYKYSIVLSTLQRYRKRFNDFAEKMLLRWASACKISPAINQAGLINVFGSLLEQTKAAKVSWLRLYLTFVDFRLDIYFIWNQQ